MRVTIPLAAGKPSCLFLSVANSPDPSVGPEPLRQEAFDTARVAFADCWRQALQASTKIDVPEPRVMAAMHNLLIQNLTMGHRYSVGNPYERTFLMEGHLSILPLLWFGFAERYRSQLADIAELSNGAGNQWYESWERGTKLSAAAHYYRLTGDDSLLRDRLAAHREYLESMTGMLAGDPRGLLSPERYAWDIPEVIYGAHSQAVAWRGLTDIIAAYRSISDPIADEFAPAVERFGERLHSAIADAEVRLSDGSLFVPIPLASGAVPFSFLPASRQGNYWNLVFPFALTSGVFSPSQARDVLAYMDEHGGFFLGMTRFSGLYEPIPEPGEVFAEGTAGYKVAGIDNAFGIHHVLLLADLEQTDRVALALYSKLAHGMTRGTYLDGEATTLGAVPGEYYRSSWYPPNSTSNALFLITLRTMLAHEHVDDTASPVRLSLAASTPRHWLDPGCRIAVTELPTSFGKVSYVIDSRLGEAEPVIDVSLDLDSARPAGVVELSVRAPSKWWPQQVSGTDAGHVTLTGDRIRFSATQHSFRISVGLRKTINERDTGIEVREHHEGEQ
jgi:hypothetical protein